MKINTMDELFLEQCRDLYDAEKQILKALPKMAKAASSEELREAFEEHLEQTQGQVQRLEQIFTKLGQKPGGVHCKGAEGLIEEGQEMISDTDESPVRDAGLIAAAQRVEHYEIAGYGSARTFAEVLGHDEAADLLQETLDEEKETDEKLTEIAESIVNEEALEEGGEEDEEEEGGGEMSTGGKAGGAKTGAGVKSKKAWGK